MSTQEIERKIRLLREMQRMAEEAQAEADALKGEIMTESFIQNTQAPAAPSTEVQEREELIEYIIRLLKLLSLKKLQNLYFLVLYM